MTEKLSERMRLYIYEPTVEDVDALEAERDTLKEKLDDSNATWFRLGITQCETIKRAESAEDRLAKAQDWLTPYLELLTDGTANYHILMESDFRKLWKALGGE